MIRVQQCLSRESDSLVCRIRIVHRIWKFRGALKLTIDVTKACLERAKTCAMWTWRVQGNRPCGQWAMATQVGHMENRRFM